MANNQIPTNSGQLIGLGNKMLAGLNSLGTTLGITQITPAQFQAELAAFTNEDNAFNALRSAKQAASDAFHTNETTLSEWLGVVKGVLSGRFGARWSTMWAQAGYINNSTALPSRIEDRIALAGRLVAFFTANPGYQVPSMNVTAAHGTTLQNATLSAQQALMAAEVALTTKDQAWTDAYTALTEEMRSLIKILEATLAGNDPRWLAFGLNMPATHATPGQPVNLAAHVDGTGALIVQCDPVPLATRYRWRMLILGVQAEYQLVARSVDPMGSISNVVPGQTVQIIVQAVNGNLQGVASDPVVFTMPVSRETAEPKQAVAAKPPASNGEANGNGHSNGHANGHAAALPRFE